MIFCRAKVPGLVDRKSVNIKQYEPTYDRPTAGLWHRKKSTLQADGSIIGFDKNEVYSYNPTKFVGIMELNLGRLGPFLSDRLLLAEGAPLEHLKVEDTNLGWFYRIISWIYTVESYGDENRKTISCLKKYLTDQLGESRLNRICMRYQLDFEELEREGSPLLSRDLAKIIVGTHDVKVEDIEDLIAISNEELERWPAWIDLGLRPLLQGIPNSSELDSSIFARLVTALSNPPEIGIVSRIEKKMDGMVPTEKYADYFHDPLLSDRERLQLSEENPTDNFETFVHNFVGRILGREMNVGMVIPAPNKADGTAQYYLVAGKLITGEGMVCYFLKAATQDADLKPIRFYRGTSPRSGAIDAASSMITDLEYEIGKTAYESGKMYQPMLDLHLGLFPIGVGHSLGSTLLQYHLCENREMKEVYLFNGPGLSEARIESFNEQMSLPAAPDLSVHIRDANTDSLSSNGGAHIGYKAPPNVKRDYQKIYPPIGVVGAYAHVYIPGRENRNFGLYNGYNEEEIDAQLYRKELTDSNEALRVTIGPCIARILRWARDFFRWLLTSRTFLELGLHICKIRGDKYVSNQYRPEDIELLYPKPEKSFIETVEDIVLRN